MATFEIECEEIRTTPPINLIFTHSKKRLRKLLKKFGCSVSDADQPRSNATAYFLENNDARNEDFFIVYMEPCLDWSAAQDAGILAHEATHVAQDYMTSIGEDKPSPEFEAYIVGHVTQELVAQHFKWKKKRLAVS